MESKRLVYVLVGLNLFLGLMLLYQQRPQQPVGATTAPTAALPGYPLEDVNAKFERWGQEAEIERQEQRLRRIEEQARKIPNPPSSLDAQPKRIIQYDDCGMPMRPADG